MSASRPVLTLSEAAQHPHNRARSTFVEANGKLQPAPAPRFSRTVPAVGIAPAHPGQQYLTRSLTTGASRPNASTPSSSAGRSSTPEP